ncbi:MAG TPA: aspartate kinase, partial [Savagea sp.]
VILRTEYLTPENEKRVIERVQEELQPDHVHLEKDLSMVVLVGEGMRHTLGLASRAAGAISRSGASIQMINQGSSEVSLVFGILTADETRVLKSLYDEFFKS